MDGVGPAAREPGGDAHTEPTARAGTSKIPDEVVTRLYSLAHNLSNANATVMHASYLLGHAKLDKDTKQWVTIIDRACRDAASLNREMHDILRALRRPF